MPDKIFWKHKNVKYTFTSTWWSRECISNARAPICSNDPLMKIYTSINSWYCPINGISWKSWNQTFVNKGNGQSQNHRCLSQHVFTRWRDCVWPRINIVLYKSITLNPILYINSKSIKNYVVWINTRGAHRPKNWCLLAILALYLEQWSHQTSRPMFGLAKFAKQVAYD